MTSPSLFLRKAKTLDPRGPKECQKIKHYTKKTEVETEKSVYNKFSYIFLGVSCNNDIIWIHFDCILNILHTEY